ncbi:MAG: 4-alpha-glucanotransferase [Deltaproteobacteria bacterium]|nr:4-alpha-glucanotransferase [Deltaproteobacteria bacterium]
MNANNKGVIFNDLWATKSAGFLLPLFSLRTENSLGIGDIADLYPLIDWAAENNQRIIQILPINDTSPGDASPYAAISTFAANPLYISIDSIENLDQYERANKLIKQLTDDGIILRLKNNERVDYDEVRTVKLSILSEVFEDFIKNDWTHCTEKSDEFLVYMESEKSWITDYALFCLLKEKLGQVDWRQWPEEYRDRDRNALDEIDRERHEQGLFYQWLQWIFSIQWNEMRSYAHKKGVYLMGDVAFYPGIDSAEVWARRDLFQMDVHGNLEGTAGAPPDMFNWDGQSWGNPLYNWEKMAIDDYGWWRKRVERECAYFDLYRLDHFRGFESYWFVPNNRSAKEGYWVKGPGEKLLQRLLKTSLYEKLAIPLAEDLGSITPEVHHLRKKLGIAGYKTFIFGWGEGESSGLASGYRFPEEYDQDFLATTGTHDTPTLAHWWENMRHEEKEALIDYLCLSKEPAFGEVKEHVLQRLYHSRAQFVILPFQDIVGFSEEHRINFPGTFGDHNWSWRMPFTMEFLNSLSVDNEIGKSANFVKELSAISGRCPIASEELDHRIAILPGAGTIQQRNAGENFNIWIMSGEKYDKIAIQSELTGKKEIKVKSCADLPDKGHLYHAEIPVPQKGIYSITVKAGGRKFHRPYVLKVNS